MQCQIEKYTINSSRNKDILGSGKKTYAYSIKTNKQKSLYLSINKRVVPA